MLFNSCRVFDSIIQGTSICHINKHLLRYTLFLLLHHFLLLQTRGKRTVHFFFLQTKLVISMLLTIVDEIIEIIYFFRLFSIPLARSFACLLACLLADLIAYYYLFPLHLIYRYYLIFFSALNVYMKLYDS